MVTKPEIPDEVREAITQRVKFGWHDEMMYYMEVYPDTDGAIFRHMVVARNWLDGTNHTAEQFCAAAGRALQTK